ncbi:MAG: NAD-binding protein [Candidatus Competibacter sp.]
MTHALLFSVFVIASCGLIYELIAGTLASYLLGDSVTQFSTIIGTYLFAMGIGSWLSRYVVRGLIARFIQIELAVGILGGFSAPDQIAMLRRFGFKVFYGDATRLDLLEAAGIAKARLLVVALDDVDASLRLVDAVRSHYPQVIVVARARNVTHVFGLMNRGVERIERETFESALRAGRRVLRELGFGAHESRLAADTFRRHDLAALDAMFPHYQDETQLISMAQTARDELTDLIERDRQTREREHTAGWG